jgi:serine/threonine protein kinase
MDDKIDAAGFRLFLDKELIINYGGYGVVVRAATGTAQLAVKLMVASQAHIAAAAIHECQVLSELPAHPNVVRLHSAHVCKGSDPKIRALVAAVSERLATMDDPIAAHHRIHSPLLPEHDVHLIAYEMLSGRTLFEAVTHRPVPLPKADVRCLFLQLSHAVAHCHSHGIAHLDLKVSLRSRLDPPP